MTEYAVQVGRSLHFETQPCINFYFTRAEQTPDEINQNRLNWQNKCYFVTYDVLFVYVVSTLLVYTAVPADVETLTWLAL